MARLRRSPALIILSMVTFLAFLAVGDSLWQHVSAIAACANPNPSTSADAWPAGYTIAVNISGFPSALQPCVQSAFDNWNAANTSPTGNGTGVKFSTVMNGTPPATGSGGGTNVYQVTYGTTTDPNG